MKQHGHTLLELSIVIGVIGILISLALPSYQHTLRQQRRRNAVLVMQHTALQLIQRGALRDKIITLPGYHFTSTCNSQQWQLIAQPQGSQQKDSCGTLTLNEIGRFQPNRKECWR